MSIQSWKARFYPVEAYKACSNPIEALKHSIRKWSGATKANLSAHGLVKVTDCSGLYVKGDDRNPVINFGTNTCALCQFAQNKDLCGSTNCRFCPIVIRLGHRCYEENERGIDAYGRFVEKNDPRSMIALLKKVLAKEEKAAKV